MSETTTEFNQTDQEENMSLTSKILEVNKPQREALLHRLETLDSTTSLKEQLKIIEEARAQWDELGVVLEEEKEIEVNFAHMEQTLIQKIEQEKKNATENDLKYNELLQKANQLADTKEGEIKVTQWEEIQKSWQDSGAKDIELWQKKYTKVQEKIEARIKRESHQKKLDQLETLVKEITELKEDKEIKVNEKQKKFAEIKKQFQELNLHSGSRVPKLREQFAQVSGELNQEMGWERWSNTKRKESLVEKAKSLLENQDLAQLSTQLKEVQDEWKSIGFTTKKDDEIWNQFRETCDKVYEKLKVYHGECQAKKEELLKELEGLKDSDKFKKTTERITKIQEEWKKLGHLPWKLEKDLSKKYREYCDSFFNRRREYFKESKEEQKKNIDLKQALIDKVTHLGKRSQEWKSLLPDVKKIQQEWKRIGPVPRNKSDAMWKSFQEACNVFYDLKRAEDEVQDAAFEDNLKKKEEILEKMDTALEGSDLQVIAKEFSTLEKEWNEIGFVPRSKIKTVEGPFKEKQRQLQEKQNQVEKDKRKAQENLSETKSDLCIQLENVLFTENWDTEQEAVKSITENWNSLGVSSLEKALKKRYKAALQFLNRERNEKSLAELKKLSEQNAKALESSCLKLEGVAGIEAKQMSSQARHQLMVAELQSKLGKSSSYKSKEEEAKAILKELRQIGFTESAKREEIESRVKAALEKINS